jgi:hypothetical protein
VDPIQPLDPTLPGKSFFFLSQLFRLETVKSQQVVSNIANAQSLSCFQVRSRMMLQGSMSMSSAIDLETRQHSSCAGAAVLVHKLIMTMY